MLDRGYRVDAVRGWAFDVDDPHVIWCSKKDGVSLCAVKGTRRVPVEKFHSVSKVTFTRAGHGDRDFLTGKHKGVWDAKLHHSGGVTTFRMRSEGEARHFKKWIEKYAARKGGN